MTDSLQKPQAPVPWGFDIHFELAKARDAGLAVDPDLERRIEADYLLKIRRRLQGDEAARTIAAESKPAVDAEEALAAALYDLVQEGSEDYFRKAVRYVLEELDHLRELEPAAYIVDQRTGKLVAPVSQDTVFQPEPAEPDPDLLQHGITLQRPPLPVVHPAITSALALSTAERTELARVQELAADPVKGNAYRHLTEPNRISELAREKLEKAGVTVSDQPSGDVVWLEFGREALEADLQSTNTAFHRLAMYSAIVAIHVQRQCGAGGVCWIGEVERRSNSRQRWYTVPVSVQTARQLS